MSSSKLQGWLDSKKSTCSNDDNQGESNAVPRTGTVINDNRHLSSKEEGYITWPFNYLPPAIRSRVTYFRVHFLYIVSLGLIGGGAIYANEKGKYTFVNCLFTAYSACTVTGFIVLDNSALKITTQVIILILIIMGGGVLLSAVPVYIRCRIFEDKARKAYGLEAVPHKELCDQLAECSIEYRALRYVFRIVLAYWVIVQLVIALMFGIYLTHHPAARELCQANDMNRWWWAFFHSISAFNNAGFGLFRDNMIQWASNHFVLVVMAFDIMLGNTCFPAAFRFIVWCLHHATNKKDPALKLLLEHPRKCFTHLFGGVETRNLLLLLLAFTVTEFALSLGVEYDLPMYRPYDGATRSVIIFFQAISTRTAGFNAIDVSQLAASISVLSVLMMYLAVYPTLLTIKTTRVRKDEDQGLSRFMRGLSMAVTRGLRSGTLSPNNLPAPVTTGLSDTTTSTSTSTTATENDVAVVSTRSPRNRVVIVDSPAEDVTIIKPNNRNASDTPTSTGGGASRRSSRHKINKRPSIVSQVVGHLSNINILTPVDDLDASPFVEEKHDAANIYGFVSRDLPMLFLALFLVCISDDNHIRADEQNGIKYIAIWPIFYEIISAFGTVGLSYGYPGTVTALSAQLTVFSRFVIMFVMIMGRHRGLPDSIDPAVKIPDLPESWVEDSTTRKPTPTWAQRFHDTVVVPLQRTVQWFSPSSSPRGGHNAGPQKIVEPTHSHATKGSTPPVPPPPGS